MSLSKSLMYSERAPASSSVLQSLSGAAMERTNFPSYRA